ncbi:MAG: AprI/Inh family metalloprotease inhibitor [Verrucomicrobiota bacterium]
MSFILCSCETTDTTGLATPAANGLATNTDGQPVLMPSPSSATNQIQKKKTKTEERIGRAADGAIVKTTESSSTSASLDFSGLVGSGAARAFPGPSAYVGKWNVVQADGKRCTMTLQANKIPATNQYRLTTGGCFHEDLFGISRWSLEGYNLVIQDAFGDKRHSLSVTGPNVLKGGGLTLTR